MEHWAGRQDEAARGGGRGEMIKERREEASVCGHREDARTGAVSH